MLCLPLVCARQAWLLAFLYTVSQLFIGAVLYFAPNTLVHELHMRFLCEMVCLGLMATKCGSLKVTAQPMAWWHGKMIKYTSILNRFPGTSPRLGCRELDTVRIQFSEVECAVFTIAVFD